MFTTITPTDVIQSRKINDDAKLHIIDNLAYINKFALKGKLWTLESAKIAKTDNDNTKNVVLFLAPANSIASDSFTLCPWANDNGCKENCIAFQGRLGMVMAQKAQMARTVLYLLRQGFFKSKLVAELQLLEVEYGTTLLVRPDGTSDVDWRWLVDLFPYISFYGYSKGCKKVLKHTRSNYKLTFSGSNANPLVYKRTVAAIMSGINTAIALNTAFTKGEWVMPVSGANKMPFDWVKIMMKNFDLNDDRTKDAWGTVGYLKRKGSNKLERLANEQKEHSFFFSEKALHRLSMDILL